MVYIYNMLPAENKKIKLFNKCYKEMQNGINKTLKRGNDKVYSIKNIEDVKRFCTEIDENSALYTLRDLGMFDNVFILKRCFFGKPALNTTNKTVVWKFLDAMYSIGKGEKQIDIVEKSQGNGLEAIVNSLVSDSNSGFSSMIDDISKKLEISMKGKTIDQSTLISDLMSGNLESCGIDFRSIIDETSKKLKERVDSGEVDISSIKEVGEKIMKVMPIKNLPKK
jgi:hypothetical protein